MPALNYDLTGDVSPLQGALEQAQTALKDTTTEAAKTDKATAKLGDTSEKSAKKVDTFAEAEKRAAKESADAAKAIEAAAKKQAAAVERAAERERKAKEKAAAKAAEAASAMGRLATATDSAKKAAAGAGGPIGDMAGRVENFASAAKGAAVALGPVGLAITGIVVGAGLFVTGVVAAASAVVDLTRDAKEAAIRLKDMRGALAVSDEEVGSITSANDALDLMSRVTDRLKVGVAGGLAPAVERIAVLTAAFGFATIDLANYLGGFGKVTTDVINFALSPFNSSVAMAIEAGLALSRTFGGPAPQALQDFAAKFAASIKPVANFEVALIASEQGLADYIAQARIALTEADLQKHFDDAAKAALDGAKAKEEDTKATEKLTTKAKVLTAEIAKQAQVGEQAATSLASASLESISARLEGERMLAAEKQRLDEEEAARRTAMLATQSAQADAAIQKQTEDIGMLIANMTAAFSGFQQARVESLDAEVARRQEAVDTMLAQLVEGEGTLSAAQEKEIRRRLNAETAAISALEKRKKRAAIAAFIASKTASLAQVAVDTARNLVSFAAPPPLGLGPIAGPIAAVALGGLGAAAVLAAPPPAFRAGGEVPTNAPRFGQSDQRMVLAEPGEKIVNPEQQRKQGGGGPIVALLQFGDSEIARLRATVLQGAEAERAIRRASGMLGMVPAYGG